MHWAQLEAADSFLMIIELHASTWGWELILG